MVGSGGGLVVSLSSFAGQVFGSVVANLEHFEDQPDRETPLFVGRVVRGSCSRRGRHAPQRALAGGRGAG